MHLPDIQQLASIITTIVDEEVMPRFTRVGSSDKADGSVVTEADLITQQRLQAALKQAWPEIPLLGEEMDSREQEALLHKAEYLWCLDPLDGTSNFASGVPFFCTSLALLHHGKAVLGIIYDPIKRECYSAVAGEGAWLNGKELRLKDDGSELARRIAIVDLKRLTAELASRIALEQPFRSQRNFGSGALDWAWLASGRVSLYLHGGQKLWDYAAGELILKEAGGYSCSLDGQPVASDRLVPRAVVAATTEPLFHAWCAWIGIDTY